MLEWGFGIIFTIEVSLRLAVRSLALTSSSPVCTEVDATSSAASGTGWISSSSWCGRSLGVSFWSYLFIPFLSLFARIVSKLAEDAMPVNSQAQGARHV